MTRTNIQVPFSPWSLPPPFSPLPFPSLLFFYPPFFVAMDFEYMDSRLGLWPRSVKTAASLPLYGVAVAGYKCRLKKKKKTIIAPCEHKYALSVLSSETTN